jgi:hypothetical protein
MKKQFAVIAFIFLFALTPLTSFAYIIIDLLAERIQVHPTTYMNAQTVFVKVLDANGNMLTGGQVAPGGDLYFPLTGNESQVLEIYHMASGAEFIVGNEIMP